MTQHELSELLNIDYDNLAAYEAGVERINAKLLFQIAQIAGRAARLLFSRLHLRRLEGGLRFRLECEGRGIQPRRRNYRSPSGPRF
jgi:transcriptional regulator with XRE-family HTH domain